MYVAVPSIRLPSNQMGNDATVAEVRRRFRGSEEEWTSLERAIRYLLRSCGTQVRHIEVEHPRQPALHAANCVQDALGAEGRGAHELDAVVYGSIARTNFEPATACEVAGRIGARRALAFDVVGACAGPLLGLEVLRGRAALEPDWQLGALCSASLSEGHIAYDIQSLAELEQLAAGLTIGNAASGWLVGRHPFRHGGRVVSTYSEGFPENYDLCAVPTKGTFRSSSAVLGGLAALVPSHVQRALARGGWSLDEVDLFVLHQPSNKVLSGVAAALGVPKERIPQLHGRYANTEASSVPLALRHLFDAGALEPGMKLCLGSAAAGFTLSSALVEWQG